MYITGAKVTAPSAAPRDVKTRFEARALAMPIALALGFGLTIAAFFAARNSQARHEAAEFRRRALVQFHAIQGSLQRHVDTAEGLRTLFELSETVTATEFRNWVAYASQRHPDFQAVEWAPHVILENRERFEQEARTIHPGFRIYDWDPSGRLQPAAARAEYFPMLYVEPRQGNEVDIGVDVASSRTAADLHRAIASTDPILSSAAPLIQRSNELRMVITIGVYINPAPPRVPGRYSNVQGVIRTVFLIDKLFDQAWQGALSSGVDAMLLDPGQPPSQQVILFRSSEPRRSSDFTPSPDEMRAGLHHEISTTIGSRELTFIFRPDSAWTRTMVDWTPLGILLGGLSSTLLLGAYIRSSVRRTSLIEAQVSERTAQLQQLNAELNREIADRRRTEEELRRSEARVLAAQAVASMGTWEVGLKQNTLEWSQEVYRIFGRNPDTFRPTNDLFYEAVHPHDRARVRTAFSQALETGAPYHIDHRILLPDGSERVVLEHAGLVKDHTGAVSHIVGTVQDITDRKRAEERLALERNLLEAIIESLPDPVFVKDTEGRFIRTNSANLRMLGLDASADIAGKTDSAVLPSSIAAVLMADDARVIQTGEPLLNREERIISPGGEQRWLLTSKVPYRDSNGRVVGVVGIARDITEIKRAAEERGAMERKFRETQKLESLGVLAGGIAHDFNNLLTGILGNASLARMELPPESPLHLYLEEVEHSSQRAADLCKQMLAYAGKGRFVIQSVNLSSLVQETTHLLQLSISKKAILKLDLAHSLPAVMADATQLRQIVMNLVINASEAIGDRNGVITIHTTRMHADRAYLAQLTGADDMAEGEYVSLEVTDNGSGMSPSVMARIFEPFFTTKFTGRGLGLAAVLGIVRGHKGALKAYSEEGRGTTFKLLLPAAGNAPAREPVPQPKAPSRGAGTVLIVDDEDSVRSVVSRMLRSMGFDVLAAVDGANGLELYRARRNDISAVLLDLTMPRMDGEETFREIRRLNPNAFVVLMSGFNEQDAIARFVGKGLAGFLQKPFTPDQLRAKLDSLFTSRT